MKGGHLVVIIYFLLGNRISKINKEDKDRKGREEREEGRKKTWFILKCFRCRHFVKGDQIKSLQSLKLIKEKKWRAFSAL